jgi:hypothetical protein
LYEEDTLLSDATPFGSMVLSIKQRNARRGDWMTLFIEREVVGYSGRESQSIIL